MKYLGITLVVNFLRYIIKIFKKVKQHSEIIKIYLMLIFDITKEIAIFKSDNSEGPLFLWLD